MTVATCTTGAMTESEHHPHTGDSYEQKKKERKKEEKEKKKREGVRERERGRERGTDCRENGRRSGSWSKRSEDEWFWLTCRMEPWRPGVFFFKCVKVLSWNVIRDLILSQISILVECWCAWYTRAVHAWKTVLPDQAQKSGRDGRTKAVGERADGLQLEWYGSDGFDGFNGSDGNDGSCGSDGSDGVDSCDGLVVPSGEGIKAVHILGLQGDWENS